MAVKRELRYSFTKLRKYTETFNNNNNNHNHNNHDNLFLIRHKLTSEYN